MSLLDLLVQVATSSIQPQFGDYESKVNDNNNNNNIPYNTALRLCCEICNNNKQFASNSALSMHQLVHSGLKPFACTFSGCKQTFRQKGHLVSHLRKHSGEKSYTCTNSECSKRFKDHSGLRLHLKYNHCIGNPNNSSKINNNDEDID